MTGASGGIGRAICERLSAEGASVTGLDRVADDGDWPTVACDLGDAAAVARATDQLLGAPKPDILIHAAAASVPGGTLDTAPEDFTRLYEVNVTGFVRLAQPLIAAMAPGASIVIVSSINARFATPSLAAYAATKAALDNLTATLALELAPRGIRVNAIAPASIDTPLLAGSFDRTGDPVAARAANVARHPLGRIGQPADVANAALFLASDEAGWITGAVLRVDGGAGVTRR
ncbi:SDR family NAD(P)-dependent oxidoreductase [Sphingomonas sp. CCH15-F11]|uniref:SDR family NAD(P)-dependent oxidoreductase n=1 Tax=Sphingomonas sp. CCH15-F11 TaxID=1768785 RepID=UPI001E3288F4|nr:SDR family oxidoreductase [Sphingomonas sp. CCH15-F11]